MQHRTCTTLLLALSLTSLGLLALPPAGAFHEADDCLYNGPAVALPVVGGSGTMAVCALHQQHLSTWGGAGTYDDHSPAYVQLFEEWTIAGRRAWVGGITEANQYEFSNPFAQGSGTRINSDTGAWVFDGFWPPLAGGSVGAGVRQFQTDGGTFLFGGTSARLEASSYVPVLQWTGGGVYYAQNYNAASCQEALWLNTFVLGQGGTLFLVGPRPCVEQVPHGPVLPRP